MGTMVQFNSSNIDELGLVEGISENDLDTLAGQIGMVEGMLPIVKGDMYLKKCEHLRIKPFAHSEDMESLRAEAFVILDDFCATLRLGIKAAQTYAQIARDWPRKAKIITGVNSVSAVRMAGLDMEHYRCISTVLKENPAKAIAILQEAQAGKQNDDGSWDRPFSSRWVRREVKAWQGDAKATMGKATEKSSSTLINTAIPEVSKTLNSLNLPAKKQAVIENKIERALEKEVKKLQVEFTEAVDVEVAKRVEPEKKKWTDGLHEHGRAQREYDQMRDGIKTTITAAEFKSLRQFCHPDKHPEREAQARKVYDIVEKIGDKLGFVK